MGCFLFLGLAISLAGCCAAQPHAQQVHEVAVIGAGIGGASFSYFLNNHFNATRSPGVAVRVTVHERTAVVGGRLRELKGFGNTKLKGFGNTKVIELGGAAWTTGNKWMAQLADEMHVNHTCSTASAEDSRSSHSSSSSSSSSILQTVLQSRGRGGSSHSSSPGQPLNSKLGIWGEDAFFDLFAALESKGGPKSVAAAALVEAKFLNDVGRNYQRQAGGKPFESIEEFLSWPEGDLKKYASQSMAEFFSAHGVDRDVVEGALVPLNRAIYNAGSDCNAFAPLASMTAELSHHHVDAGNSELVRALLAAAVNTTVVVNSTVTEVSLDEATAKFTVVTSATSSTGSAARSSLEHGLPSTSSAHSRSIEHLYDTVVFAAPVERTGVLLSGGLANISVRDRGFKDWHVTVVEAESIDARQFESQATGKRAPLIPGDLDMTNCAVLTMSNASANVHVPFVTVQPLGKHGTKQNASGPSVWMVYSDKDVSSLLSGMFVNVKQYYHNHWPYTFAALEPITGEQSQLQPIVMHSAGLFNINALESIATAMEISAIGARNVARLVSQNVSASHD